MRDPVIPYADAAFTCVDCNRQFGQDDVYAISSGAICKACWARSVKREPKRQPPSLFRDIKFLWLCLAALIVGISIPVLAVYFHRTQPPPAILPTIPPLRALASLTRDQMLKNLESFHTRGSEPNLDGSETLMGLGDHGMFVRVDVKDGLVKYAHIGVRSRPEDLGKMSTSEFFAFIQFVENAGQDRADAGDWVKEAVERFRDDPSSRIQEFTVQNRIICAGYETDGGLFKISVEVTEK